MAELLGYSSLWQAVCTRLGRPVARSTEELQHELGEDLQVLLHGAQARLGTAAALEQGLLVHLGRLRDSRRGSRARRWSCARPWTPSPTPCPS
ncbi:hypothetical protein QEG98_12370 [Myxococcus sp. MxC21-1]|uniref:hypothetical protein n=1 Tax=Myxococcus sp. MxC21-1 TaxID=3041439 RepID=UPI00292D2DBA|nr:hypothetical protein [Myxococcus sp. MxC21-1]WNZ64394.1 hypothetical protein QEG98_12370 [Myxococcus sp. MxC21-1]